jgi:hypothetical protein
MNERRPAVVMVGRACIGDRDLTATLVAPGRRERFVHGLRYSSKVGLAETVKDQMRRSPSRLRLETIEGNVCIGSQLAEAEIADAESLCSGNSACMPRGVQSLEQSQLAHRLTDLATSRA